MHKEIFDLFHGRHCCRAFLPDPVDRVAVDEALTAAGRAPSSKNTQPWGVEIVTGARLEELRAALLAAFDESEPSRPDYQFSPDPLSDIMKLRARACGFGLFQHKGIARDDRPARHLHARENFRLFGAPACVILTLPHEAEKGTFFDGGLFMASLLLSLRATGYEATPMFSVASYSAAIRRVLGIPYDRLIALAAAFGKEDPDAHVNAFRTDREPLESFVRWHD